MTTYALMHGGCHGAWCWAPVVDELAGLGHDAIAVDMPITDPAATPFDYADVVAASVRGVDDYVLVGHSLGGVIAPFVAELARPAALIFVAAALQEGAFGENAWPTEAPMLAIDPLDMDPDDDGLIRMSADSAVKYFFHDVEDELAERATRQLRPQGVMGIAPPRSPVVDPSVPVGYVITIGDRAIHPAWQRWVAADVLHARTVELEGGHSPFLTRPRELAEALITLS